MPLELNSLSGNASWDACISREQAARLQLRKACRPLPRYKHFPEVIAETSNDKNHSRERWQRWQQSISRLAKPTHTHLAPEMLHTDLGVPLWAGKRLDDHPKMWDHVSSPPRSELFSQGAFNQLTSQTFIPKLQEGPGKAEKAMRSTDPGTWAAWRSEKPLKPLSEFTLPNHMLSYPETGEWLL
eukprot:CAMPEP_0114666574 /NCGR_PEP_ID=MMETSP0191-20121206/32793_1 /TAXON_ID=126664 /ORGANISM="Sorites sp." /LENGTH=183 /DNA_ID=CAMNT_0001914551 /DNA_START=27 /DNA_END=578 /DNA_ORIENTATION=-